MELTQRFESTCSEGISNITFYTSADGNMVHHSTFSIYSTCRWARDYYGREVPPLLMFRQVQLPAAGEGSTSGRREGFTIRTNLTAFNKCDMFEIRLD